MSVSGPADPLDGLQRPTGDPGAARAQSALLARVTAALTAAAARVESAAVSVAPAWVGEAGAAAGRVAAAQAQAARARVPVAERAASALSACAGEWESAQERFDTAVRLAASAVSEEADHRGRVTSSVWAAAGAPVLDDGWRSPDRARARSMAQTAVDDAEVASRRCAAILAAALPELGPPPPQPAAPAPVAQDEAWWDIGDDLTDQATDLWQGLQDAGDFVVDNGPELAGLALDTGLMALGAAMMAGGATGVVGGTAVSATGVGAPVGVPAAAASAALVGAGAAVAGAGAIQFGQDLQTLLNKAGRPSGGQPSEPPPAPKGADPSRPVFRPSPKHDQSRPGVGPQPTNGQQTLDRSIPLSPNTTTRRVGTDPSTGEIVIYDETEPGRIPPIFHGHVQTWDQLRPPMRALLLRAGLVTKKGKVTP